MENPDSKPENDPVTKVTRTGVFKGDWSEICQFCGKEQSAHRTTWGPVDGELFEHRLPCQPEKDKMRAERRRMVRTANGIVFFGWVLVPLAILLIKKFTIVGWIMFGVSIVKLVWETWKIYGRPDKYFPKWAEKRKKKQEEKQHDEHILYHCKKNPEAFQRLVAENFRREEEERDKGSG